LEVPVDVALAGDVRALVAAAHRDDDVGLLSEVAREELWLVVERSMPSSRMTSTTSGWTRSPGVVPADSAVWVACAARSKRAWLICERPALWRQTKRTVPCVAQAAEPTTAAAPAGVMSGYGTRRGG
jgi:hypothetical protein